MQSLWDAEEARALGHDPLQQRVYSSRLLGRDPALVMHGGGNTSVKAEVENLFGEREEILYVKGSGWDLATIEAPGFAPVRLHTLQKMAQLPALSDAAMVSAQRAAMIDPNAPNPSVEAILHAVIPFRFVDHTHADAVIALSNTPDGEARVRKLYGDRVLIVPYVMPGFQLAKAIYEQTRDIDWSGLEGMILLHHGAFSFGDDARTSYERMIRLVDDAEKALSEAGALSAVVTATEAEIPTVSNETLLQIARLRREVSLHRGAPVLARWDRSSQAVGFASLPEAHALASRGTLTPDHVIRTKPRPLCVTRTGEAGLNAYVEAYQAYFARHEVPGMTCLEPSPRWAVWAQHGTIAFGRTPRELTIVGDINAHTLAALQWTDAMGGWRTISERDLFEMEYWELEQAKLKKQGKAPVFQGQIALVTGAASGIGQACVEALVAQGAVVAALDLDEAVHVAFADQPMVLSLVCDVTSESQIVTAVQKTVLHFGGLDIVISNAGSFPPSRSLAEMESAHWEQSLTLNLTSHRLVTQACLPFLELGCAPAVLFMASKNVPAPGPGAAAYSVAKAGVTQLARIAAMEWAPTIRVSVLHPHAVFDTGIWAPEVLEARAAHYKMTVEAYKTNNLLRTTISSADVAKVACTLVGPVFSKSTGLQISIDDGQDRVL